MRRDAMPARTSTPPTAGLASDQQNGVRVQHCAHCGESLIDVHVVHRTIDGCVRAFCCLGCAFIAEQIALALGRLGASAPSSAAADARREPDAARPMARGQIEIRGMVCAACAMLIEARLRELPGVSVANVDFIARRATVVFDRQRVGVQQMQRCIEGTGYRVVGRDSHASDRRAERIDLLRVLVAWLAMMQVMMLAVPAYLAGPGEIAPDVAELLRLAQVVLAAPVVLFCASPFWRAAFSQLRTGRIGMDVPVAAGLAVASAASVWAVLTGRGDMYCDSITMFVALVLSVRWWQQRALRQACAHIDAAAGSEVIQANRLLDHPRGSTYESVPAGVLAPGDRVIVPAGGRVPADGRVLEGRSSMSQAWLTGESAPIQALPGVRVMAGSLNLDQPLVVEVSRAGERSSLAALQRLMVEAASQRPASVELANRVAARFVAWLLAASVATALGWAWIDPSVAVRNAIAVLIVTCPCALAMAVPLAAAFAQAALARRGILVARPAALEALARIDIVAFDKTGTLTQTDPALTAILSMREIDDPTCLRIAASMESRSMHPFARALSEAARRAGMALAPVSQVTESAGAGVEASVEGRRYRLGRPEYALAISRCGEPGGELLPALLRARSDGGGGLILADERGPVAMIRFGELIRDGAAALVAQLRANGAGVMLVSGDRPAAVSAVADQVGGEAPLAFFAEQTPAGKQALLASLQCQGSRVAMIGDGINDAPVLAQADASIALASGADLAQARADVVCLRPCLDDVGFVFQMARRAASVVRINLAWALAYNALMIPLAIAGRVSPLMAAAGMAASSIGVVLNSMRLQGSGRDAGSRDGLPQA
jgi:P-type Cu2+ transporter